MAEPARRLSSLGVPPELPPHVRRGVRARSPASAADAAAPWSRDALAGRLVELSSAGDGAPLTMAVSLVLDAQRRRETVAWVTSRASTFFPPDVAASGVDLDALAVIRLPDPSCVARAADRLLRSGGFGLVVLDLGVALDAGAGGDGTGGDRTAWGQGSGDGNARGAARDPLREPAGDPAGEPMRGAAGVRAVAHGGWRDGVRGGLRDGGRDDGLRNGGLRDGVRRRGAVRGDIPMPLQARLLGLAERHDAAVVCLTEKPRTTASLSSLVSLRVEARRRRTDDGAFTCTAESVKDKRRPPGWVHEEVRHGPAGLR